jgi:hypothetical protein
MELDLIGRIKVAEPLLVNQLTLEEARTMGLAD